MIPLFGIAFFDVFSVSQGKKYTIFTNRFVEFEIRILNLKIEK